MFNRFLRYTFFLLVVRPIILIVIGINIRRPEGLPSHGPAIIIANHNSHLDTMVLMSLFRMKRLKDVHPVAAEDHFMRNRFMAWFSTQIIGIIPLKRDMKGVRSDPLAGICEALSRDQILIVFPEGSRGEPEIREQFKTGIAHIAKRHPKVPFVPVFMHGLGRALPKGEGLLVPFFCDVFVGSDACWCGERQAFMDTIEQQMNDLEEEAVVPKW